MELIEWSRRKFKRADKEIERKEIELQHIQKSDIINTEKSGLIFGSQVSIQSRVNIEEITDMAMWEDLESYLGLPATELILKTLISLINKRNHFGWPYRSDGQYSVRTGYHFAKEEKDAREERNLSKASTNQNLRKVWKMLWKLPVPQKVKLLLWKAMQEILLLNANLYQRMIAKTPSCSICQQADETIEHALLLCLWTRAM
ncbi:hypothetical protein Ahy_B03g067250 [Arachis hypogaea]|uniref:Reverse transcriptase zinc-binding domain-containing protein n=1 Tax=Arachis hypogaea TaxID=3818 RepID=A0A445A6A6_ARAHY|nr:hypothetical protein Ahy_B03g067250 [Arachis hypogaea]